MLDERSRYTIQEVCRELVSERRQLDHGLLTYLQDGELKAYVEFASYLDGHRTDLSPEFWSAYTIDDIDLRPARSPNNKEYRAPGESFFNVEVKRLKTIANGVAARDVSRIDDALRPLADDVCKKLSNQDDSYWYELIALLMRLQRRLDEEKDYEFVVYVTGEEWKRFSSTHLPPPSSTKEGIRRGKAGAPKNLYWREIYQQMLLEVLCKLNGQPLHDFVGFPSRDAFCEAVRLKVEASAEKSPGTKVPETKTLAEDLARLERNAKSDKSAN